MLKNQTQQLYIKKNISSGYLFNNSLWRSFLNKICLNVSKKFSVNDLEVISPFGFEIFEDTQYLKKNLRRFYCYIGIPHKHINIDSKEVAKIFGDELCKYLHYYHSKFFNSIVLKIEQDKFIKICNDNYLCKDEDKLIDIQCRYIRSTILNDYADYVICTLNAINERKDEPREFSCNKRFRVRTYQLYLMLECIFKIIMPRMSADETKLYNMVFSRVDNSVCIFFDNKKLYIPANEMDINIMNDLIAPRITIMNDIVKNSNDCFQLQARSYHVNDQLQLTICKKIYNFAVNKIVNTYFNFE